MDKEKVLASQVYVTRQFAKAGKDVGESTSKEEEIAVSRFVTEPARVHVEMGMTVNLGNYESCRISVAITVPCYYEEHEAAYEYARSWVEKRTLVEVQEARRFAQSR